MKCIVCNTEYPLHCFPNDMEKWNKAMKCYNKQDTCKTCKAKESSKQYNRKARKKYKGVRVTCSYEVERESIIVGWNNDMEIYC